MLLLSLAIGFERLDSRATEASGKDMFCPRA